MQLCDFAAANVKIKNKIYCRINGETLFEKSKFTAAFGSRENTLTKTHPT